MAPTLKIHAGLAPGPCLPALVWAEGIAPPVPSTTLPGPLGALVQRARAEGEGLWPPGRKAGVRALLRHGKYRASGRSKPASEFLLKAALEDRFPPINPPVDVNNFVSLASGLPGTIFDLDRSGETLVLRRGRPGERYVFNTAGQDIDLEDLLLLARPTAEAPEEGEPCGNPVKDSMATKVASDTRRLVAVLYAPRDEPPEALRGWAAEYARLLSLWCGARETGYRLVEP